MAMTQTTTRLIHLIFPVLTTIGLAVSYLIWWVYDEILRSVYGHEVLMAIGIAIGVLIASPGLLRRDRRTVCVALLASYVAAIVITSSFDWTNTKSFYRFYRGIHSGMTVTEVQQRLDQTFPSNGPHPKPLSSGVEQLPDEQSTLHLRLPDSAETITVYFSQNRMTRANYSPD
jgi:hypothetical protein